MTSQYYLGQACLALGEHLCTLMTLAGSAAQSTSSLSMASVGNKMASNNNGQQPYKGGNELMNDNTVTSTLYNGSSFGVTKGYVIGKDLASQSNIQITSSGGSGSSRSAALRRDALHAFADAASYSAKAENYEHTVLAARLFWNAALPYVQSAKERSSLQGNIKELIVSLQQVYKFRPQQQQQQQQQLNDADSTLAAADQAPVDKSDAASQG